MFAVVHFEDDDSVECVPLTWLEGIGKIILPIRKYITSYHMYDGYTKMTFHLYIHRDRGIFFAHNVTKIISDFKR